MEIERRVDGLRKDGSSSSSSLKVDEQRELLELLRQYQDDDTSPAAADATDTEDLDSMYMGRCMSRSVCCWCLAIPLPLFERSLVRPLGRTLPGWWMSLIMRTAAVVVYTAVAVLALSLVAAVIKVLVASIGGGEGASIADVFEQQLKIVRERRASRAMASEL
jgi:hypothetical protein